MNTTNASIFPTSAMTSLSLQISSLLGIYILSYLLFHNKLVSNFSALFVVIADQINYMNLLSIPNTLAAVFALFTVYFLTVQLQKTSSIGNIVPVIFFSIAVLATHHLTSMYLLIIILVFVLVQVLGPEIGLNERVPLSKNRFLAISLTCVIIAFFTFFSTTLQRLTTMASIGFNRSYLSFENAYTTSTSVPLMEDLFGYFAIFLLFSLMIPGAVYMIKTKKIDVYFILNVAIFPLAISIIGIFGNLGIIEHRWWYFSQLYISIPCAISLVLLINTIGARYRRTVLMVITTFIAIICIFSISSCIDDHTLSPSSPRIYFLQSEIQGAQTFEVIGTDPIYTDQYFERNLNNYYMKDTLFLKIDPYFKSKPLDESKSGNVFIRDILIFDSISDFERNKVDQLYNNGHGKMYGL